MRATRTPPILCLLLLPLLACLMLSACARESQSNAGATGSAKDNASETEQGTPRFAVFAPAIGVMLRDLGFEDDIVGRHSYDTALSDSIPVVGSHIEIDDEMLISVNPTILIFQDNAVGVPDRIRQMAQARGWSIWTYRLDSLDDIAACVDDLYLKLVGFPEDADDDADPTTFVVDPTKRFDIELPSARLARAWSPMGPEAQAAGRTLLLAGTDPPGALGPGSFHARMTQRMGIANALTEGGMWQELDLEDITRLAPDSILLFAPRTSEPAIGEATQPTWDEIKAMLGPVASLPIPAIEQRRVGVITHPQAQLPSTTLAEVADEIRAVVRAWSEGRQP